MIKKERVKRAYINGLFTLEEHDSEIEYLDKTIEELQRKILEQENIKDLKFRPEDILIKRDMDFINRVKIPMLYKVIEDCWNDLTREEKYNELEEKNYLISHLNKVLKKLPEFIQKIVYKMFNSNYSLFSFKHDYDLDIIEERERKFAEQDREKQYSYNYYVEEEELEKNNDDGMEI